MMVVSTKLTWKVVIIVIVLRGASAEVLPTLKQVLLNLHHLAPKISLNAKAALNSESGLKATETARKHRRHGTGLGGVVSLGTKGVALKGVISLGK